MAKVKSRVLVIDASIAHAAGETSMHPTSKDCRELLQTVLKVCHRMAMTGPIQEEWNKHLSRFARGWRRSMMARKKIGFIEAASHLSLEKRIERAAITPDLTPVLEKDRHLIEAALVTEKRVISLDDRMRQHLRNHLSRLPEVQSICWVNPCLADEQAVDWLEAGAPAERSRTVGHVAPRSKE